MAYLDTTAKTTKTPRNDQFQQLGRSNSLFGMFLGFVKRADDVQRNGRLQVWIPELGSAPEEDNSWVTVNYCSPFAGATNVDTISKGDIQQFEGTQTSYGMWMVPPDINNEVLVMFINGDPSKGIWIGCLYNQFMNNMVPGMASSTHNYQYPGKNIPVAEYNKWDKKVTQPDRAIKPYQATKFKGLGNQGLITDTRRGVTDSSARRESPSQVFGIVTPGPVITKDTDDNKIRRKGGSSFIMDDAENSEYVQLTTKSGAQININETNGFVYLINRDGTSWVQMDQKGNIDIFGAGDISMRAQRDINFRADRNINIEAGQNIFVKAAKDTVESTTTFTYDVNNIPKATTIPVWKYVGEGKGTGGNIVTQALNNWHSTTQKNAFLTVIESNMDVKIGNALSVTTQNGGQDFNSKQGVKITSAGAVDVAATGNIRVGSKGSISVVGTAGIIMCTDTNIDLKANGSIQQAAVNAILLHSTNLGVTTIGDALFSNNVGIAGDITVAGAGNVYAECAKKADTIAPGAPFTSNPPADANPAQSEAAMSANTARPAEIKPLNKKLNILATWADPLSKFKRNVEQVLTTTSRFPTYEPCPEHAAFSTSSVNTYVPITEPDTRTYEGSGAKGNNATVPPAPAVNPGTDNTMIKPDPVTDSNISKDINIGALRCQLIIHEGFKDKSYDDSLGLRTGGIGHLMRSNELSSYPLGTPISAEQIETWYKQDSASAIVIAQSLFSKVWGDLSDVRKRALTDLAYNLGKSRLAKFVNFIAAMNALNFDKAGIALKDSVWFTQVGRRGPNIIAMIVQNVDPNGCDKKFPG